MKIAISAETTIDLTKELIEKFNINITPFNIPRPIIDDGRVVSYATPFSVI